jgi:hypothetical protein
METQGGGEMGNSVNSPTRLGKPHFDRTTSGTSPRGITLAFRGNA